MLPSALSSDGRTEAVFDALGNPLRRDILRRLTAGRMNVGALAAAFTVTRPAISRHLAVLEAAGLVRHEAEGTRNLYALDERGFSAGTAWLDSFWDEAERRLRLVAENLPDREQGT